ncbi:peptidyl-prolyl cis-trans isomerase FKBP4 [Nephila pilipes]|uniref:peptidylprolyl isomerase n=1 Tax=Nephila pilipes TaxID=299642 RepID=A0A8X6NH30_NEPPI|nr:peptidyl-prolyl cis-trans isomerase FKBP4 [Nephila pilipes]
MVADSFRSEQECCAELALAWEHAKEGKGNYYEVGRGRTSTRTWQQIKQIWGSDSRIYSLFSCWNEVICGRSRKFLRLLQRIFHCFFDRFQLVYILAVMSIEVEKMETENQQPYVPGPNALDITEARDKGVLKEIITTGEGNDTPCKGNRVSVHYTGRLMDGTKFDSSVDRGEMFEFTLGKGEVIKAWDIGVATMKKGEKCILVCHPDYAYGSKGSPPKIPENATLIFEVELFNWQMEDLSPNKDNGILRSILKEGEGYISPAEGANIEAHISGKFNGKKFDERDVRFELGDGCDIGIVDGLEIALKNFKKGERSKIILSPKYAFGTEGSDEFNVPSNVTVEYDVTLKSFEKEKEKWNMSYEEKLEESDIAKTKGNNYFEKGKFEMAVKFYQKIISYLQYETEAETVSEMEPNNEEKRNALLTAGYLNLAACYLKMERYGDVIENSDKALAIEPKNPKGFFRRGKAYLALQEYEKAKVNFMKVLEYDSSNKAAKRTLNICMQNLKKQLEKEKRMYQTIFKKLAEENDIEPDSSAAMNSQNQENDVKIKIEKDDENNASEEAVTV